MTSNSDPYQVAISTAEQLLREARILCHCHQHDAAADTFLAAAQGLLDVRGK